jgi:secreted PhoX family phosphatase
MHARHPRTRAWAGGLAIAGIIGAVLTPAATAVDAMDYGIGTPVEASGTGVFAGPATEAVTAASGLTVTLVSDQVGISGDMIALWPDSSAPTHAIICNEIDPEEADQASVQLVDLATGAVTDMIRGLVGCDPAKRTPWGTVIVGEEETDGRIYEILGPLSVSGVTVDRDAGTTSSPNVVARTALGQLAYEGIVLLDDGTMYYGDERRPEAGTPGGGIFKFVPGAPLEPGTTITDLAQSPLAAGSVWVARLGTRAEGDAPNADYGQGSEIGDGAWVALDAPADPVAFPLFDAALAVGYTGYYRPEDMARDPQFEGVRLCWNNTGRDVAGNSGETLCLVDQPSDDLEANPAASYPTVSRFVDGDPDLRMPDNIAFDPVTGYAWLDMDAATSAEEEGFGNDDVWVCLRDGDDQGALTDGCARALTLNDGEAEFTGVEFLADGSGFYQHLQHRAQDGDATPGTSDLILVTFAR